MTDCVTVAGIEREIARRDPRRKGDEVEFECPHPENHTHGDADPSARWNPSKRVWSCAVCTAVLGRTMGGGYVNLARALGIPLEDPNPGPGRETVYDYRDAGCVLRFQVVRLDFPDGTKRIWQRRPIGSGEWVNNLDGVTPFLYGLPELIAADPAEIVLVVEGEKCVHAARELGFVAVTNPRGAGQWRDSYAEALKERHLVLIPDNDEVGRKHMAEVAASCYRIAACIKIVELP